MTILRVFVRKTSYTPTDPLAFVGPPRSMSITRGIDWALAIFLYAFCDEFSSETDALDRLRRSVQSTRDSVIAGTLSLAEIRRALKDDFDLEV